MAILRATLSKSFMVALGCWPVLSKAQDCPPKPPVVIKELEDVPVLVPTPIGALAPSAGSSTLMPGQGSDSFVGRGISSYEMNIRLRRALVKRDQVRSRHKTGPNPPDEVMLAEMEVDLLEAQLEEQYQSAEDALEWLKAQRIVNSADVKVAAAKNEFVIGRRDYNEYKNKIKLGAGGYQLFEATFELKVSGAEQELKQAQLKQTLILTRQLERKAKELARLREEYFRKKPRALEDPALDPSGAVTSEPLGK